MPSKLALGYLGLGVLATGTGYWFSVKFGRISIINCSFSEKLYKIYQITALEVPQCDFLTTHTSTFYTSYSVF